MNTIEPSSQFRARMQARLNETRAETQRERFRQAELEARHHSRPMMRQPIVLSAVAASALIMGTVVWRQVKPHEATVGAPQAVVPVAKAPTVVDTTLIPIHLSPEMVQAMATGNPMWPATVLVDDAPAQVVNSEMTQVKALRD